MKKLVLLFFVCLQAFGQEITEIDSVSKNNPILFSEAYFGGGGSDSGGLLILGLNLNYQFNKADLLTARYSGLAGGRNYYHLFFPFFVRGESREEFAFLYGKRWVDDNFSWSVSTGVSYTYREYHQKNEGYVEKLNEDYYGVPFEFSIKWFKGEKSRFRAYYGLIPIGKKKVSFGRSVGFKLIGNISKNNYAGVAFTYGFGWHKNY